MGLFRRRTAVPIDFDDPALDDASWLGAGRARYESTVHQHYGSPDTIAAGGLQRMNAGDIAAALFFFQKAIDTMHSIYVCGFNDTGPSSWSRQPSSRDIGIVDAYLQALSQMRGRRPSAPVAASVSEVTHRMRTISTRFGHYGLDGRPWLDRLDQLGAMTPDVDVSGVYWS